MSTATSAPGENRWVPVALGVFVLVLLGVGAYVAISRVEERRERERAEAEVRQQATALCHRWADQLDRKTTGAGVYVRWEGDRLPDKDPWGNDLRVAYSQGGVAETLEVRSHGPDGVPNTTDDIVAHRMAVNFKGVGQGIKDNAEETARNAAKGAVKGLSEGLRDALRGKKADPAKGEKEKDPPKP
jgi:hypothetical protein